MLLPRNTVLVLCAAAFAVPGCSNGSGPASQTRAHVVQLSPAPTTTTVVRHENELIIRGALLATCAPYNLSTTTSQFNGRLVVTLTGSVSGTACPQDIVWTKGYRVTVSGAPGEVRLLRILHTIDVAEWTPEVIFEGSI